MGLFNFGRKKEEKTKTNCCCCGTNTQETEVVSCRCETTVESICCVKVLGAGCKACHEQYEYVKKAVENLGLNIRVEYITDMEKVMTYGVMSMPAIVINDKVVSMGKVIKTADVEKLLK